MTAPKPKQVYDNPDAYWDFVTVTTDVDFEGQHFDRKEAGRLEADGTTHNAKLSGARDQIVECVSAFANATGGLLAHSVDCDQPIRLIVITYSGDRDHAARLGRGVPGG